MVEYIPVCVYEQFGGLCNYVQVEVYYENGASQNKHPQPEGGELRV